MNTNSDIIPSIKTTVKIAAPTLSPTLGAVKRMESGEGAALMPALGFPTLVPPDVLVTGGLTKSIILLNTISIAAICCPAPWLPSQFEPSLQLSPHIRPLAPPEHCNAAALAEEARAGIIWPLVKAAICVVAARDRARYALNESISTSQDMFASQLSSTATPSWKKAFRVAFSKSCVRLVHTSEPFVCLLNLGQFLFFSLWSPFGVQRGMCSKY